MKTWKRIASTLMAIMMMVTLLAVPANAASGSLSITVAGGKGRTFEAYQIFKGDLAGNILSNVQWGDGVTIGTNSGLLKALQDSDYFGARFDTCSTASDVASVMEESTIWTEADTIEFAKIVANNLSAKSGTGSDSGNDYKIDDLEAGYYFVKETTVGNANDAYSRYIISLTSSTAIEIKKDLPTLIKKVSLKTDSGFAEGVSAAVSNTVYYSLTAQLHARLSDYSTYKLQFEDTLPASLNYSGLVAVYVNDKKVESSVLQNVKYGIDDEVNGQKVTVTIGDARALVKDVLANVTSATDRVTVVISATVQQGVTLGANGHDSNKNTAVLKYSNNPNPGNETSMGVTAEDTAYFHSYELVVNKVDSADSTKKLAGAEFTIQFEDDNGQTQYVKANETAANSGIYVVESMTDESGATKFTTNAQGWFTVKGLREREYRLKETKAPGGYNTINDLQRVIISAEHNVLTGELTNLNASRVGSFITIDSTDKATGTVTATITNNQGAVLPSTGGMGTTVLYLAGSAMMVGAAAILLAKKRFAQG